MSWVRCIWLGLRLDSEICPSLVFGVGKFIVKWHSRYKWHFGSAAFGSQLGKQVLSLVHLFPSAPCPPAGFRVVPRTVVNETQILRASWSTVNCPNSEYLLALTGSIQGNDQALFDITSYWTSRTFFEVPLPCGSTYSATISARNSAATSDKSPAVTGTTGA